ncbi:MAG: bifunctional oligoribonuclease/PAP phosphatase NrnA [Candidatus Pacebacteria bacterium]|nr:bifunctional oligoribonuclease/PAP phosphatase NrnA [Candidatus Paceibacterota bacterium]
MQQAVNLIRSSEDILILTHKNPDGDAVGSVLGLADALESVGKNVKCFSKDIVPDVFDFLPNISKIKNQTVPEKYDLVILLDCALFSRTGIDNIKDIASSFNDILIIDHHPKNQTECDHYEKCIFIIDPKVSSSAVLVYELLKNADIEITKNIANCLLTGIFTDTGGFQHSNTDSQSLEAAAEFMKKGSRVDKITKNIFNSKSMAAIKLWGIALSRIKTDAKTGMAVSYVSKKDIEDSGAKEEDLSGLVNVINTVSDAKFSLLLTEFENRKIKGSLRSEEYKGIDVSRIARSLGGGGHKLASGFEFDGDLQNNVAKISEMILKANRK